MDHLYILAVRNQLNFTEARMRKYSSAHDEEERVGRLNNQDNHAKRLLAAIQTANYTGWALSKAQKELGTSQGALETGMLPRKRARVASAPDPSQKENTTSP